MLSLLNYLENIYARLTLTDKSSDMVRLIMFFRALSRFVKMILITIGHASVYYFLTLLFGYSKDRFERHTKMWARKLVNSLNITIDFEGEIPRTPNLMVANHRSYIDIPVLYTILPGVFLAKKEVSRWPIIGFAARAAGTIFVDRGNQESRSKAKGEILKRIRGGETVYIFPEGTTSPGPKLLEFKLGMFKIVSENQLPIVPVAIQYADKNDAWLGDDTFVGHFFRTFSKKRIFVKVVFCEPVIGSDAEIIKRLTHKAIWENLSEYFEVSLHFENPT
ncbi:MAG: 1-acyl-sn-glycerol-3-phosphate acyltransferase [Deltaproteobacteria bacterium]|nr:1-acyl-sn-glycerol-3-phosphate acyltransferase [Deltaproteobacteria bacterium]